MTICDEAFMYGSIFGSFIGVVATLGWWYIFSHRLNKEEPTRNDDDDDDIPDFQQTLITLSKIPGLEIKGEGIHIKGPDLKGDGKT